MNPVFAPTRAYSTTVESKKATEKEEREREEAAEKVREKHETCFNYDASLLGLDRDMHDDLEVLSFNCD
jgi:hypothetical protein